jgi:hypothetical protein
LFILILFVLLLKLRTDDGFWKIRKEHIAVCYEKLLGSGDTSHVYYGELTGKAARRFTNAQKRNVAVKLLKITATEANKKDFQKVNSTTKTCRIFCRKLTS